MLKNLLRRFGYLHMDEVKPMLSQCFEAGIQRGYSAMMSEVRSPQEAVMTLSAIQSRLDSRKGLQ